MDELISRQRVREAIEGTDWYEIRNGKLTQGASREEEALYKATDVYKAIENVPSAEPQIIRCKDCKHYQFADNRAFGFPVKRCEWTGFEDVEDNDFCSRAERKENR